MVEKPSPAIVKGTDVALAVTPEDEVAWHAFPTVDEVYRELETSAEGLTSAEAEKRLQQYGRNALTPPKKPGFLAKLWAQVNNVLIWILIVVRRKGQLPHSFASQRMRVTVCHNSAERAVKCEASMSSSYIVPK
jgi:magnesium-transporting ATPase (P-type)